MDAFRMNAITEVIISSTVETMEYRAFDANPIVKVQINGVETRFNDVWISIGFPFALMPEE